MIKIRNEFFFDSRYIVWLYHISDSYAFINFDAQKDLLLTKKMKIKPLLILPFIAFVNYKMQYVNMGLTIREFMIRPSKMKCAIVTYHVNEH